jgi:hypothetical protein
VPQVYEFTRVEGRGQGKDAEACPAVANDNKQ